MYKKRFLTIALVFAILLSISAFALDETLEGIAAESPAYIGYQACVDSCKNCADDCKFNAYRMAAEIDSNEELCNQLPDGMKELCINRVYSSKAAAAKDSALCEKISMEQERNMCILNVQIEKAISWQDETECSSAPEGLENACVYAYNMRTAMENRDLSKCEKIGDNELRANCNAAEGIDKKQCNHKSARIIYKVSMIIFFAAIILIIAIAARKKIQEKTGKKGLVKKKRK